MQTRFLILTLLFFSCTTSFAEEKFKIFIELGSVWQQRNDSQIPNSSGTRTALDELDSGPFFHHRLEAYYKINNKHGLRLVYAPFDINISGQTGGPVTFDGRTFDGTRDLDVRYKFNSYRLTYIYSLLGFGKEQINFGITAKVRDALTAFSQDGETEDYDNIGFVPLIYFEYQKILSPTWSLNFTADAAYASQGRAIDAALKLRKEFSNKLNLGLGLRTLEGGADNDEVYAFSWFTYAITELTWSF